MSIQLKDSGSSGNSDGFVRSNYNGNGYGGYQNSVGGSVPPTRYSQPTVHVDDSFYYERPKRGGLSHNQIMTISDILEWIVYGAETLAGILLIIFALTHMVSADGGMSIVSVIITIQTVVILIDALFQVLYRKESILLIVFAFILSGCYPIIRGKIIDGQIDTRAIISIIVFALGFITYLIAM